MLYTVHSRGAAMVLPWPFLNQAHPHALLSTRLAHPGWRGYMASLFRRLSVMGARGLPKAAAR
jgi:hypothetical protein